MSGVRIVGGRKPRSRVSRLWAHLGAYFGEYFWLPCPVCGEHFGGQEVGGGTLLRGPGHGSRTCPRCPGYWLRTERGLVEIEPHLTREGTAELRYITSSSAWPKTTKEAS